MNTLRPIVVLILSVYSCVVPASCFDQRQSVEGNYASCKQAAEQGDSMAQYFLGQMYRKGEGVAKDPEAAVNWYRKAAERGNRLAQFNLAWMYDIGEDVERNLDEAISWYAKAAQAGDPYAPFNIGALYFNGRDLPRDPETALFWFEVAIANGNAKGQTWRDKIVGQLSSEQLERVQSRLREWNSDATGAEAK
jgi:uncharacterized protein